MMEGSASHFNYYLVWAERLARRLISWPAAIWSSAPLTSALIRRAIETVWSFGWKRINLG
jgi:hypothetical protein